MLQKQEDHMPKRVHALFFLFGWGERTLTKRRGRGIERWVEGMVVGKERGPHITTHTHSPFGAGHHAPPVHPSQKAQ